MIKNLCAKIGESLEYMLDESYHQHVDFKDCGTDFYQNESLIPSNELFYTKPIYTTPPTPYYSNGVKLDNVYSKEIVYSPEDLSRFVCPNNKIKLKLCTTGTPANQPVWRIFLSHGVSIVPSTEIFNDVVTTSLDIRMQEQYGFIQLYSVAKRFVYNRVNHGKNTLMTFFFFKDHDVLRFMPSPPIIPVFPSDQLTYVPLVKDQILQVITRGDVSISFLNSSNLRHSGTQIIDERFSSRNFRCHSPINIHEKINYSNKKTIDVPPIVYSCGKKYACVNDSIENFDICCYNIDGISIPYMYYRTQFYADKHRKLYISKNTDYNSRLLLDFAFPNAWASIKDLYSSKCVVDLQ